MKPTLDTPLSDNEIDDLDAILLESGLDAPMDISMLDGFLCAVLSGPRVIPPAEWLPWVWDFAAAKQVPEFHTDKAGKHVASLVMRFANEIALNLTHVPDEFEPLFPVREADDVEVQVVDEWCFGYLKGISLDPAGWRPLIEQKPGWFEPLDLFGTEEGWKKLETLVDDQPDAAERHQALVARIAPAIRDIHAHWRAKRGPDEGSLLVEAQPIRNAPKPGRNDPCYCGSGRKYKVCHGLSEGNKIH